MWYVRRAFGTRLQDERLGQVVEIPLGRLEVAEGAQTIERVPARQRREIRHQPSTVGDLDRLSLFDATQEFTDPLSQLPNTNRCHVLLIPCGATRQRDGDGRRRSHRVAAGLARPVPHDYDRGR